MTELLVRDGDVITPGGVVRADVLVRDGVIAAIGSDLATGAAGETVDASGAYVIPGGVDAHVHLQSPQGALMSRDDFTSGTAAAAFGGTTTVLHFCIQEPGERFDATLARWHAALEAAPPVVDVGFHLLITDLPAGGVERLPAVAQTGVTSFKAFMAGPPAIPAGDLVRVMQAACACGAQVMVHAEDGDAIDVLVEQTLAAGRREPSWHAVTRPPALETAAAMRAIELARVTGAPLYLVHVGAAATVRAIRRARAEGVDVVGETCPQYLLLDPSCLEGDDAARMIFTPPPRDAVEREGVWDGLVHGDLSTVASDHTAFSLADKAGADDFTRIAQGIPGVEPRVALLHHAGVAGGRLSPERWVELVCAAPARRFGLWPRKGVIAPGSDADLVVFDPSARTRISSATHHMASDFSAYEGMEVVGAPRTVIARGRVVVDGDTLRGRPGDGRFLARDPVGPRSQPTEG